MPRTERTLILFDGSIVSVLACAAIAEEAGRDDAAPRGMLMLFPPTHAADRRLSTVLQRCAELFAMEVLASPAPDDAGSRSPGEQESRDLLAAGYAGARQSCTRILWPVNAAAGDGLDLDRIAAAHDRSILVSRLVALDAGQHGVPGLRLDTPYIDLSDRQVADLAVDMDLPLDQCGWWEVQPGGQRERWTRVLREAGWVFAKTADAPR